MISINVELDLDEIEFSDICEYVEDKGYEVIEECDYNSLTSARGLASYINNQGKFFLRSVISELVWCSEDTPKETLLNKLKEIM